MHRRTGSFNYIVVNTYQINHKQTRIENRTEECIFSPTPTYDDLLSIQHKKRGYVVWTTNLFIYSRRVYLYGLTQFSRNDCGF